MLIMYISVTYDVSINLALELEVETDVCESKNLHV